MPKTILTGTLDEQCTFLFNLAQEKMAAGNNTGAIHALKEILKYAPDFPGAQELMAEAKAAKREQATIVWLSMGGAIVAIFAGTLLGLPNDLWLLALAAVGWVGAYLIAIRFVRRKGQQSAPVTAEGTQSAGLPQEPKALQQEPQGSAEESEEPGAQ
jgi:predicted Zn-dependent protease